MGRIFWAICTVAGLLVVVRLIARACGINL